MKKSFILATLLATFLSIGSSLAQISFSGLIDADHTFNVPSDFSTINDVLDYLSNKTLKSDVIVTIDVADGTYSSLAEVKMLHPQGDQIYIIGNTTTPANCVLQFAAYGFIANDGHKIGLIDGFTISGANTAYGVYAGKNSSIYCGTQLYISQFGDGVVAEYGGTVHAQYVHSSYNTGNGMLARAASIDAGHAVVDHNVTGVLALDGGTLSFTSGDTSYNTNAGVQAYYGGVVKVSSAYSHNNTIGYLAQSNGTVCGVSPTMSGNTTNKQTDAYGGIINF